MSRQRGELDEKDLLLSKAYVAGKWVDGSGDPIAVDDPYTLETVGQVPRVSEAQVSEAIDAANRAFPQWARRPAKERGAILRRWYELVIQHKEDFARLITLENGKALKESRAEVDYGAGFLEFYADEATRSLGEIIPAPVTGRRLMVEREPIGVCVAITPWNFPLAMLTRKVGPALAAGCTMVAKPAELTPLTALAFAKLGEEAGVPAGVFSVVTGNSKTIGPVMTGSPIVRKLSFTGSTPVGAMLAEACAPTIKRLGLELGGNAPLLIFDDADLDTAVETAMVAKFRNGGQSCVAANRIYVQNGIRSRFLDAFGSKVAAMKAGDGFEDGIDVGPMIDDRAIAKIDEHREDALRHGGRLIAGGASPGGRIAVPTLIGDVAPDALLTREETFGPLAGVIGFASVEDGVRLANDTPFGLAAYLCSSDPATIARVGRDLESGIVGINTGLISTPYAPFGGVKQSGLGREGSHHGLAEYQNLKYLCHAGL
ncbi:MULTISPECIES: NAD-dependent succinate-semialdehyde dehydrogenase [unclassified Sphingobium]|uniref:NAD-dependent succinate-semialdehyde dehydrogenase n=1 Tax=unclassified Sphingobium TaxID=2611147 RepID=UPI00222574C7|nr:MULTISPECIES: NAD-dependent succinate-semialdehyde dehydrogenase [unclassified Sphingobium]MCW2411423.1 succinate-semialdehyde dehydrogenase/glutarate-semialdehyde dehydrogenase [Sphingobium sp. B8D3D]MCW2416284.1 succinate-semialdehyde dehydrogenase/glutarate-semialdehyde dehydrogenase [Sphingobium sp. B8D3A]